MREPWEAMFEKLKSYEAMHGHCNVPAHRDKLGRWVEKQRTNRRVGQLCKAREKALESIGFRWKLQNQSKPRNKISSELSDESFYTMVNRVVDYISKNGHGWIPAGLKDDKELGIWSKNRRAERNNGRLKKEREEALEKAGFIWKFANKQIPNRK